MERLRKDDYLYGVWEDMQGRGFLIWLIRRDDELVLMMISQYKFFSYYNVPFTQVVPFLSGVIVDLVRFFMVRMFGLNEIMALASYAKCDKTLIQHMQKQFEIFDTISAEEKIKAQVKPSADAQPDQTSKITDAELRLVETSDAEVETN
jgi:hypothetical protein